MAIDVSGLTLIGEGRHGTVYRLDNKRCIKIYKKEEFLEMEYEVLTLSQRFSHFPRVYACKENYMIREYFAGPSLLEYLWQHPFSESLALKLLEILDSFVELDYSRIDCRLPHIIVTEDECLKVIDPTRNMTKKCPYPRKLLSELNRLGVKDDFLKYTKAYRPDYYQHWTNPSQPT